MCISAFRPSSSLSNSLTLFIHSTFLLCSFCCHNFVVQNRSVSLASGCWLFLSCYLLSVVDRIFFRCFGMSCFVYIISPFVHISLIFLLSPVLSGLFPQVVLLFFLCCPFLFVPTYSSIFPLFYHFGLLWFFICVSRQISHPGFVFVFFFFVFFSCFLRGSHFFHKLFSPLH